MRSTCRMRRKKSSDGERRQREGNREFGEKEKGKVTNESKAMATSGLVRRGKTMGRPVELASETGVREWPGRLRGKEEKWRRRRDDEVSR